MQPGAGLDSFWVAEVDPELHDTPLTFQAAQLGWEAQNVVALRFVRLAGGGAAGAKEAQLMVTDKLAALTEAQLAAVSKCPDRGWS
jgi:hypothetical protein